MTFQRNQINASGTLYPNPRYGQEGEPPLRGAVYCRANGAQRPVRYEVSAWYQFPDSRLHYRLRIGDGMSGVMCRWWDHDHKCGLDMEGTAGIDHEYIVEAWFVDRESSIISIQIYSTDFEPNAATAAETAIDNDTSMPLFI